MIRVNPLSDNIRDGVIYNYKDLRYLLFKVKSTWCHLRGFHLTCSKWTFHANCSRLPIMRIRLQFTGNEYNYLMISITCPAPTVRPPSRIAKRRPLSIATGTIRFTVIVTLSPGITISRPSGSTISPVTSVVRR